MPLRSPIQPCDVTDFHLTTEGIGDVAGLVLDPVKYFPSAEKIQRKPAFILSTLLLI
jgi:hypothetical protein